MGAGRRDVPAERVSARVDGTAIWFEAVFDDETVLSTSPPVPPTSWGKRLNRLDRSFAKCEPLQLGRLIDPDTSRLVHS